MNEPRVVTLGGYSFSLVFAQNVEVTERPPQHGCNVIVDVALTFDLRVISDGAKEAASWKDKLTAAFQRGSDASSCSRISGKAFGLKFTGVRFEGFSDLGADVARELYFAEHGSDLLAFAYTIGRAKNPHEAEWREHLLTLVATTLSATQVVAPPPEKPVWKFW